MGVKSCLCCSSKQATANLINSTVTLSFLSVPYVRLGQVARRFSALCVFHLAMSFLLFRTVLYPSAVLLRGLYVHRFRLLAEEPSVRGCKVWSGQTKSCVSVCTHCPHVQFTLPAGADKTSCPSPRCCGRVLQS